MRPAVRLAALMQLPSIFVWTHDSVALGEDGPTHQPIEQLATLRAIPGLDGRAPRRRQRGRRRLARRSSSARDGPAGIALTRQNIPVFERGEGDAEGDTLASAENAAEGRATSWPRRRAARPTSIFIGTGSEVQLAVEARDELRGRGHQRPRRLGAEPRMVRRAARRLPRGRCSPPTSRPASRSRPVWRWSGGEIVGDHGRSVSIEHFGASADYKTLFREFGMTTEHAVSAARESPRRPERGHTRRCRT